MPNISYRLVMGFDVGTRRIGVAIGQPIIASAKPLSIVPVEGKKLPWPALDALIREWEPDAFVVGIPLNRDGTVQPITLYAQKFADALHERYAKPVHPVDERYSTVAARQECRQNRLLGSRSRVDDIAAAIILEEYLQN
jgi:putative Holliday junction resolvase